MPSAKETGNVMERDWNVLNIVEVFVSTIVSFSANHIAVARETYSCILFWGVLRYFFGLFVCLFFFSLGS